MTPRAAVQNLLGALRARRVGVGLRPSVSLTHLLQKVVKQLTILHCQSPHACLMQSRPQLHAVKHFPRSMQSSIEIVG